MLNSGSCLANTYITKKYHILPVLATCVSKLLRIPYRKKIDKKMTFNEYKNQECEKKKKQLMENERLLTHSVPCFF